MDKQFFIDLFSQAKADGISKIVAGAFIVKDGNFLILRRADEEDFMAGFHEIASGHVDDGEDIDDGLRREVNEETGLIVQEITKFVNSFDYQSSSGKRTRQYNFFVEVNGDISLNPSEHSAYLWVNPQSNEFDKLNLSSETKECILSATQTLKEPKWVALEGIDAVGKSTQIQEIKKKLRRSLNIEFIDEFSSSEIGNLIRNSVKCNQFFSLASDGKAVKTETTLLIADALYKAEYQVENCAPNTELLLSDRGTLSIIGYQAVRAANKDLDLEKSVSWVKGMLKEAFLKTRQPDLTILLTASIEEVEKRCLKRGDSLDADGKAFLEAVQGVMTKVANASDGDVTCIQVDGLKPRQLSNLIIKTINNKLG